MHMQYNHFEIGQQFLLKGVRPFRNPEGVTVDTVVEIVGVTHYTVYDHKWKLKVVEGGWTIWNTDAKATPPDTAEIEETFETFIRQSSDEGGVFYNIDQNCVPLNETTAFKSSLNGPWEQKTRRRMMDGYLIPISN